ncbi:MAG: M23 family metallopeptidase [Candidatus Cryptobacteroides sp.]
MSRNHYILDKDYGLKKVSTPVWKVVRRMLLYLVASASLAVCYYVVFALIFNTDEEKKLRTENKMYEKELPALRHKSALVNDAVEALMTKDNLLYEEIFKTPAPSLELMNTFDYLAVADTVPDKDIVMYAGKKIGNAEAMASLVEENFLSVMRALENAETVLPPLTSPLKDFTYAQTGASTGNKISPFYKVAVRHDGLDLIAPAGEPVYAAADGTVSSVTRSRKGLGNVVEITHAGGYMTRYAHLSDIEVNVGRNVKRGTRIAHVGMSGNSFAPHLHYEVVKDTLKLDPVNHFFGSVGPAEYANMLYLSVSTAQSME